jgi:TonB family protein
MNGATYQIHFDERESLRRTLGLSLGLHFGLILLVVGYNIAGARIRGVWGSDLGGGGDSVQIGAVASLPGVPLPSSMQPTRSALATQSPGLYKTEEVKPEPKPDAQEIPKFKDATQREKLERINKRIQREEPDIPANAVPFGQGGPAAMTHSQFAMAGGGGGLSLGQFGDKYSWYVNAVRTRVSSNWLLSMINPNLASAPRVYVTFEITKDGHVENAKVTQSSGIPEVDRSALRAVLASNPFGPLPVDYPGSRVPVEIYFDLRR